MSRPLTIRRFDEARDAVPEITAMLHAAYAGLARMGFRYSATHQDDATTLRRLQKGEAFVAEWNGALAGTITLTGPQPDSKCEWYRRAEVWSFGQFGVRVDLQRCGIGSELYRRVENRARELGAAELALDTAEGARHLREWYERLGYRVVQEVEWGDTNYRSVVMSKGLPW